MLLWFGGDTDRKTITFTKFASRITRFSASFRNRKSARAFSTPLFKSSSKACKRTGAGGSTSAGSCSEESVSRASIPPGFVDLSVRLSMNLLRWPCSPLPAVTSRFAFIPEAVAAADFSPAAPESSFSSELRDVHSRVQLKLGKNQ